MLSYKYQLYDSKHLRTLDLMMAEAAGVWNHAIALQQRYYSLARALGWEHTGGCTLFEHREEIESMIS